MYLYIQICMKGTLHSLRHYTHYATTYVIDREIIN
mgnify:CR=1 FL=1